MTIKIIMSNTFLKKDIQNSIRFITLIKQRIKIYTSTGKIPVRVRFLKHICKHYANKEYDHIYLLKSVETNSVDRCAIN